MRFRRVNPARMDIGDMSRARITSATADQETEETQTSWLADRRGFDVCMVIRERLVFRQNVQDKKSAQIIH